MTKTRISKEDIDIELPERNRIIRLRGTLGSSSHPSGIVIFAHGSGSSRLSPRNIAVADQLNQAGIGTLLFDLLTKVEGQDNLNVFDIPFLSQRLVVATQWLREHLNSLGQSLPFGYFGASTGAGAALEAAALQEDGIAAVVSRGGRPDLAREALLKKVRSPTLLIVGSQDEAVLEVNRTAMRFLSHADLVVVPGATHLFEEPGALELVAQHAIRWFGKYFGESASKVA